MSILLAGLVIYIFLVFIWLLEFSFDFEDYFKNGFEFFLWIICIGIVGLIIIFKSKEIYVRVKHKINDLDIYRRELPSDLKPVHVRMLFNNFNVYMDKVSIISTLIDLLNNGYIEIKQNGNERILIKTDKGVENLFEFEKYLLTFLPDKTDNINLGTKKFIEFNQFNEYARSSFPVYQFFTKNKKKYFYILPIIIAIFLCLILKEIEWSQPFLLYWLTEIIINSKYMYLNEVGIDEKDNWQDFKKFLIEFTNIKDESVESLKMWNFYLIYAVALDINTKSVKEMESLIENWILI